MRIATRTISGLYDGATTAELDRLSIQTASSLIAEEPQYSTPRRAPPLHLHRQGGAEPGHPLVLAVRRARRTSTGSCRTSSHAFVQANSRKAERRDPAPSAIDLFEYLGVRTVVRPLPAGRSATRASKLETPQYFFLRVACGLAEDAAEALELYTG